MAMTKTILKGEKTRTTSLDDCIADSIAPMTLTSQQGCDVASLSSRQPTNACDESIRTLAYHNWEEAGCPAGDGVDFWLEAEREINMVRL